MPFRTDIIKFSSLVPLRKFTVKLVVKHKERKKNDGLYYVINASSNVYATATKFLADFYRLVTIHLWYGFLYSSCFLHLSGCKVFQ